MNSSSRRATLSLPHPQNSAENSGEPVRTMWYGSVSYLWRSCTPKQQFRASGIMEYVQHAHKCVTTVRERTSYGWDAVSHRAGSVPMYES
jgi:hypothetical protein